MNDWRSNEDVQKARQWALEAATEVSQTPPFGGTAVLREHYAALNAYRDAVAVAVIKMTMNHVFESWVVRFGSDETPDALISLLDELRTHLLAGFEDGQRDVVEEVLAR